MSDQPGHKSSVEINKEIEKLTLANQLIPPAILMAASGGRNLSSWIDDAFKQAQEDKERFLGTRPPKVEPQPNPAISKWQKEWATASMNNKRELGPGDVKK